MAWIRRDLEMIPKDQLVVLMMHIPLVEVEDRQELYRLIEMRPYAVSVSAHTHYQEHKFITKQDGWRGPKPHHHVFNVTVCGSWWQGSPDELGIPHATMRDGAPNGYSIFTFDGHEYSIEFRAARRPSDYQMNIYVGESVSSNGSEVVGVNFFAGNERTKVEMRVGNGEWLPMDKVAKPDPEYSAAYTRDLAMKAPYRPLPMPIKSPHYWEAQLPADLPKGSHRLSVRATDMFGHVHTASRLLRVEQNLVEKLP
ncbi:MAG: calcineurin-like phosphoesterase C-terminal domain-containing protein [Fimbriimonadales bacterium]